MTTAVSAGQLPKDLLPRRLLIVVWLLVLFTVLAAGYVKIGGMTADSVPEAEVLQSRDLRFSDLPDGSIAVLDPSGQVATVTGEAGFIRGVLRSLARQRMIHGVGSDLPFRLVLWNDGRLSIEDLATGELVELTAFGRTNSAAFAGLLQSGLSRSRE